MKARIDRRRLSPAMVIATIAALAVLGGSAWAAVPSSTSAPDAAASAAGSGKLTLRFGKLVDRDTTPLDGSFFIATGKAVCAKNERVISGGVRQVAGNPGTVAQHIWLVESTPVLSARSWVVKMNSDLGGAARQYFKVVATCERR